MLDEARPEQYIRTTSGRRRADRVIWIGLGRRPDPTVDTRAIAVKFVSGARFRIAAVTQPRMRRRHKARGVSPG
jgi:hypothetical protein